MSEYSFITDLCESHLIPSQTSLKRWDHKKLAELAYLYFLGLRILLAHKRTEAWARNYCGSAGDPNDFSEWRTTGNDLYAMLYALSDSDRTSINPSLIRHWLRRMAQGDNPEDTHRLFMRLDPMFRISNSQMQSMRRIVTYWEDADSRERKDVIRKLIQLIHSRAPSNSELLPHLQNVANVEVDEAASGGATGAASVATVPGTLGAGFDNDYSKSIYGSQKPVVIRR